MIIFPAIDIRGGNCVRLLQGRAEDETVYGSDPALMAKRWADEGAEWLHVVDLDGAFSGEGKNLEAVRRIAVCAGIPVQTGGGIRSMKDVEARFEAGVQRVILGTAAVNDPDFAREATRRFGPRIVAGIDARDGFVAVKGWLEQSGVAATELAKRFLDWGADTCVYTDISRDGMLKGVNAEAAQALAELTGIKVIASGGVSGIEDIVELTRRGVYGAITGKALYDGALDLAEAIRAGGEEK